MVYDLCLRMLAIYLALLIFLKLIFRLQEKLENGKKSSSNKVDDKILKEKSTKDSVGVVNEPVSTYVVNNKNDGIVYYNSDSQIGNYMQDIANDSFYQNITNDSSYNNFYSNNKNSDNYSIKLKNDDSTLLFSKDINRDKVAINQQNTMEVDNNSYNKNENYFVDEQFENESDNSDFSELVASDAGENANSNFIKEYHGLSREMKIYLISKILDKKFER